MRAPGSGPGWRFPRSAVVASVLTAMVGLLACAAERPSPARPHVLWIVLDACRAGNLSAYGYERPTSPNLERLAARGVLFEHNFAQSKWTAQSVPSYMTGRYFPVPTLHWPEGQPVQRIANAAEHTLPAILGDNGYRTVMFSAHRGFITAPSRLSREFEQAFHVEKPNGSRVLVPFAALNAEIFDWLERLPTRGPSQPLFLYVHAVDTHFPHELDPPFSRFVDPRYSTSHLEFLNSGQQIRRRDGGAFEPADRDYLRALHDGSVLYADHHIGRLLRRLETAGLLDDMLVVVGADHGDALGEDGRTVGHAGEPADELLHVPLILAGPGLPGGSRVGAPTENVDIVPTLIELLRLETTARPDGSSLLPLARGDSDEVAEPEAFAWIAGSDWERPDSFLLRTTRYKYQVDRRSGAEHLWRVPDRLGARRDEAADNPRELERLRRRVAERFLPLWRDYLALPVARVELSSRRLAELLQPSAAIAEPAASAEAERVDQRWTNGVNGLCSAPWSEDAAALRLAYPLADGAYVVEVGLPARAEIEGRPASSLRLTVEGRSELLVAAPATGEGEGIHYLGLGEVEVDGGALDLTVAPGSAESWACLRALRVTATNQPLEALASESEEERRRREKELRALGYLE